MYRLSCLSSCLVLLLASCENAGTLSGASAGQGGQVTHVPTKGGEPSWTPSGGASPESLPVDDAGAAGAAGWPTSATLPEATGGAVSDVPADTSAILCAEPGTFGAATFTEEVVGLHVPDPEDSSCALRVYGVRTYCGCREDLAGCGERGTCIHFTLDGSTPTTASETACLCLPGYEGQTCSDCADGYVQADGACVDACERAGLACPSNADCTGDPAAPECTCTTGYTGPDCQKCSEGFVAETMYHPETGEPLIRCNVDCPECGPGEVCVTTRSPPYCECNSAYTEAEDGVCRWNDDTLELPSSVEECGRWAFYRTRDVSEGLSVSVQDGGLVLDMDNGCAVLIAATVVNFPDSSTLEAPAVRVTTVGDVGSFFGVSFGEPDASEVTPDFLPEAVVVRGSGGEQTVDACVPPTVQGSRTWLLLWLRGPGGMCLESTAAATVLDLQLVSSADCVEVSPAEDILEE